MCENCKQETLSPEFESIFQEFNETEYESAVHRSLGPGRIINNEYETQNEGAAVHRSLGKGRPVSSNEYELELVGPADERKQAVSTDVPFRWICSLELHFKDPDTGAISAYSGSGILISPRHILTAGHCIMDEITGARGTTRKVTASKIIARPGRKGSSEPFGKSSSIKLNVSSAWSASLDFRYDYGLITLADNIGSKTFASLGNKPLGFWGSSTYGVGTRINPGTTASLKGTSLNISGYPGDKPDTQWYAYGKVVNTSPAAGSQLIYYEMDTCGGQSGGAVWLRWQNFRNLVAIHTGPCIPIGGSSDCAPTSRTPCFPGNTAFTSNRAVHISSSVWTQVKAWMT